MRSTPALIAVTLAIVCAPAAAGDDDPPRIAVTRAKGEVRDLPAAYHHALTDDEADDLVHFVNTWITQTAGRPQSPPSIEYRRGVAFVENEEDRGDDPPYPRSAGREAQLACGTASTWLRAALLADLQDRDDLACYGNVCTYPGMEYAPDGTLVFRPVVADGRRTWILEAWVQQYRVAGDDADGSAAFVRRSLAKLARARCPGEPAGAY
jgi:hypothetical protein